LRIRHLILSIFICFNFFANAKHIVGGGFNLVWLHDSTFQLNLRLLRDCNSGVDYDPTISIGTFDLATNKRIQVINMSLGTITNLNFISTKCASTAPPNCVDVGDYTKTIILSPKLYNNSAGYYFSWERCCRNNIIQNIQNPGTSGMTFYMEIPPPKLIHNSSPKWTNNPRTLLCNNNPFTYNFNFIDPDGDSLVYSLVNPLQGNTDSQGANATNNGNPKSAPYPPVTWLSGFDNANQITGTPPLSINSKTGQISVTPNVQQGVYVSAVLVEEYRFGKKLGEVRLELEYTIIDCMSDPFPLITLTDSKSVKMNSTNITIQIPEKLCFNIVTTSAQDSLYLSIDGALLDSNWIDKPTVIRKDTGNLSVTTQFCWQTDCKLTGLAPQAFTITATDNGCPLPKTTKATFTVTLLPLPLINPTTILCMTLINNKETIVFWGDSTGTSNPNFYKYNLYRNKDTSAFSIIDTFLNKSIRQFDDKNTPNYALVDYNYFMRGVNICGFEGPTSDTMGTFDQLKAIPLQQSLITVTVENNDHLKILWPPTKEKDFAEYFLYKTTRNDTNYKLVSTFLNKYDTVFFDYDVNIDSLSYCYELVMKDTCGNVGPSGKPSCSIVLKGTSAPFENQLSWLPYTYWNAGTQNYSMFRMDTQFPFSNNTILDPSKTQYLDENLNYESGKYNYFVEAHENISDNIDSYNAISRSNEIELTQQPIIYVPNAFTANDDGLNDDLNIHHVFVKDYTLKIFNRWGQKIFETTDKNVHWKGEGLNGINEQSDVYVYLITYSGWDNNFYQQKGNLTLLR